MTRLDGIGPVEDRTVVVEAGVRWDVLVGRLFPLGLMPPILPDHLDLSVGGTLSVGGVGGTSFRDGCQVDHVVELEVVTGEGELVRCSPDRERELFDLCRAGLGQFGILVRARLSLVPPPHQVRVYTITYPEAETFAEDHCRFAEEARFDDLTGGVDPLNGGWRCQLKASVYLERGQWADDACLAGLEPPERLVHQRDLDGLAYLRRFEPMAREQQQSGLWHAPHPWLSVYLPGSAAAAYLKDMLSSPPAEEVAGYLATYPLTPPLSSAPLFRLPEERRALQINVLLTPLPGTAGQVERRLAELVELYQEAVRVGGTVYPVCALPLTAEDWRHHYGQQWNRMLAGKLRFDPDGILTPGPGIPWN